MQDLIETGNWTLEEQHPMTDPLRTALENAALALELTAAHYDRQGHYATASVKRRAVDACREALAATPAVEGPKYQGLLRGDPLFAPAQAQDGPLLVSPGLSSTQAPTGARDVPASSAPTSPVAWRVKDFADGWILCRTEGYARHLAEGAGNLVQPLYAGPQPPPPGSVEDRFNGDNAHLCRSIEALLSLNDKGSMVPHGMGGLARALLSAAAVRLTQADDGWREQIAHFLWGLLDDIDTASDAAKGDDRAYRKAVETIQRRRFEVGSTNGYIVKFKPFAQWGTPPTSTEGT